jgi:pyrimidine-nucleoside phosphorylase
MRMVDIVRRKRDGRALDREEIRFMVAGAVDGRIPDYQLSALLMAIVLRGMTAEETAWLTEDMLGSGARVDLSGFDGPKADKHSTGGVGDKTSLIIAPLAAACGVIVPMMSGRALGHTGGTLDKLESIAGFRTALSLDELRDALGDVGCALIGQTAQIAPADRILYALRDVTATVESIPLISASIMSKKLAEGIDALVLDVKTGRGAFMKTAEDSRRLADSLVSIGARFGVNTEAVVTRMDAPLGRMVGNAVEVIECVEVLKGRGPADLEALSVLLTSRMLLLAGVASSEEDADRRVRGALASGAGLERFRRVIEQQGGDPRVIDDYALLPSAPDRATITAARDGYVTRLDAELIGRASVDLGAGRNRVDAAIDHGVGIVVHAPVGARVAEGDALLELQHRGIGVDAATGLARQAIDIGDAPPVPSPLVVELRRAAQGASARDTAWP